MASTGTHKTNKRQQEDRPRIYFQEKFEYGKVHRAHVLLSIYINVVGTLQSQRRCEPEMLTIEFHGSALPDRGIPLRILI